MQRNLKISDDVAISEINNESVILNLNTGIYFQTNELGSFIVSHLNEYTSLESLKEKIMQNFEVTEDQCQIDLLNFIEILKEKNLLNFQ
tara:strand:- start:91 stop:357 length:267 start_codon:yes stop_codon:yes gene_type:complete